MSEPFNRPTDPSEQVWDEWVRAPAELDTLRAENAAKDARIARLQSEVDDMRAKAISNARERNAAHRALEEIATVSYPSLPTEVVVLLMRDCAKGALAAYASKETGHG